MMTENNEGEYKLSKKKLTKSCQAFLPYIVTHLSYILSKLFSIQHTVHDHQMNDEW